MRKLRMPAGARFSLLFALTAVVPTVQADPGDLKLSFGQNGVALVSLGGGQEFFGAALPDSEGRVLAAGALYHRNAAQAPASGYDMSIVRVLANGQLDTSFGLNGLAQVDSGDDGDAVRAMIRQSDGKLLLAGRLDSGAYSDFGLARLHPNGSLDTSFGEPHNGARRGYVRLNIGPSTAINDGASAVVLQSDGRIVLGGEGFAHDSGFNYQRFSLARFLPDGSLDTSFGNGGTVVSPATGFQVAEYITAIATRRDGSLPDDRITAVGYVFARGTGLIRRYLANGQPDPSFGVGGTLVLTESVVNGVRRGMASVADAVWLDDGKLLVLGTGNERGFVFQRFHADGSLDTSFGNQGRSLVKFSGSTDYDEPAALHVQPNGRIVATGYASMRYGNNTSKDFAVVRLQANGQPDPRFGDGQGRSTYPASLHIDEAFAVTIASDGDIVAAGRANNDTLSGTGNSMQAALMRLQGDADLFSDGFE